MTHGVTACSIVALLSQLLSGVGAQPPSPEYARGKISLSEKRYVEAAEALGTAERNSPHSTDALLLRARALIHLEQWEEAEASLRQFREWNARSADATFLLGYVLFRRNEPGESLTMYTAGAALRRPTADDFKIVGLDYVLLNAYTDAVRWLERAVAEDPYNAEAYYHLGRAYYTQNRFDRAIAASQKALELNPMYGKAENNLGLSYAAQNRIDLAEHAYRKAIELDDAAAARSEQPYMNLAELLLDHNRAPEALILLDKAGEIQPRSDRIETLRGRGLLLENRLAGAEAAFRMAIAIQPASGILHYQLGRVLKREGKSDEAKQEFEKSKALLGTHSASPH